jgi:Mrp family chromosome partitioning ATPase
MPTEVEIMNALQGVVDPELGRSIVDLKMIRDLKISDGHVAFTLALTVPSCPLRDQLLAAAEAAVKALPGVKQVDITMTSMTDEERRAAIGAAAPQLPKLNKFNQVKHLIAVMSGKGGVGKSSVTALLATALANRCQKVGVLDADITGPSIPKLFGLPPGGLRSSEQGLLPAVTGLGIKAMSINLLVDSEDAAVIWRGPMISSAIGQFWTEVIWGKLDYLLVDMPPGTSDAALTVMRNLPVNGVVLVTTPQQLATLVVKKAVAMLHELKIPVVGVVENMSYYTCPDCGKQHAIFGPSHAEEVAKAAGAPVAARLPIVPEVTDLGDAGQIEQATMKELEPLVETLLALPEAEIKENK